MPWRKRCLERVGRVWPVFRTGSDQTALAQLMLGSNLWAAVNARKRNEAKERNQNFCVAAEGHLKTKEII